MVLTILNYTAAFLSTVIIPCVAVPANWEHCSRIDKWLIPDLIYAWELKTGKVIPYQIEKEYLRGTTSETP